MKYNSMSVVVGFAILCVVDLTKAQGYRGIVPLHSTCEDVKRVLSVSTCNLGSNTYDLSDEVVKISFSKLPCEKAWQRFWNVPPGTVLSIERFLRNPIPLSSFQTRLDGYEKVQVGDINETIYGSERDGLRFSVIDETVRWIVYTPSKNDESLLCPSRNEGEQDKDKVELPSRWFDRYGELSFAEEKKRLDNLASELRAQSPVATVLLVVYAAQGGCESDPMLRAKRAKRYLVETYKISSKRIKIINAGKREKVEFVIYLVMP